MLGDLREAGVDLFLHKQGLDTSTSAGRAMFGMLGIFAEYEREMIRERIMAGLARAKAEQATGEERTHKNGRIKKAIGRPRGRSKEPRKHQADVLRMKAAGVSVRKTAGILKIAPNTVSRIIREDREARAK